jgi:hypothetical protein
LKKGNKEILTGTSVPFDTCLLMGDPKAEKTGPEEICSEAIGVSILGFVDQLKTEPGGAEALIKQAAEATKQLELLERLQRLEQASFK